jgi:hypothetical protein
MPPRFRKISGMTFRRCKGRPLSRVSASDAVETYREDANGFALEIVISSISRVMAPRMEHVPIRITTTGPTIRRRSDGAMGRWGDPEYS